MTEWKRMVWIISLILSLITNLSLKEATFSQSMIYQQWWQYSHCIMALLATSMDAASWLPTVRSRSTSSFPVVAATLHRMYTNINASTNHRKIWATDSTLTSVQGKRDSPSLLTLFLESDVSKRLSIASQLWQLLCDSICLLSDNSVAIGHRS